MKTTAKLQGKTVIITGAAGGIGRVTAALLQNQGAQLALCDLDWPGLEQAAKELAEPLLTVKCDITTRHETKALVAQTLERFGKIDAVVNNAGIIIPARFEKCSAQEIEKQVAVNLMGTINMTSAVLPALIKGGGGNIVTISSMAGIVPETFSAVYAATKFALRGLNLTLALELKEHNISVSTIFPDTTDTPMLRFEAAHGGSPLTFLSTPQPPEKVARAVLRAVTSGKLEQYVPYSSGIMSKLLMVAPATVIRLWPVLERYAKKNKKAYQKKHNIAEGD